MLCHPFQNLARPVLFAKENLHQTNTLQNVNLTQSPSTFKAL